MALQQNIQVEADIGKAFDNALMSLAGGYYGSRNRCDYDSRTAVTSSVVDTLRTSLRTAGYANAGDGGEAVYRRVSSEPVHPGKVQSADGAWWEIGSNELNVLQFGAIADGASDCYDAFQDALAACRSCNKKRLLIPAGTYRCTRPGLFNTGGSTNGFSFVGAGMGATVIRFINGNAATQAENNYLYTNVNTDLRINFVGIRFEGDSVAKNSRFGRIASSGTAQSIRFWDVMWYEFEGITTCEGGATSSEMLYVGCKASNIYGVAFRIDNIQSVNHNHHGCDYEVCLDDVFYISKGGMLNVFGGSIIIGGNGVTTGAVIHLADTSGVGIGFNNWTYNFYGVRTELKDHSQFLNGEGQGHVNLIGCNTEVIAGSEPNRAVYLLYHGLMMAANMTRLNGRAHLQADNSTAFANRNRPATLIATDCLLGSRFSVTRDNVSNAGGRGKAILERCKPFSLPSGISEPQDQCLGWNEGSNAFAVPKRIATIKNHVRAGGLPLPGQVLQLKLPIGAVVTGVRLYHPSENGPDDQVYVLGNSDGSVVHSTWLFDISTAQTLQTTGYWQCDSDTNRTLHFTGGARNSNESYTGYCEVEYIA